MNYFKNDSIIIQNITQLDPLNPSILPKSYITTKKQTIQPKKKPYRNHQTPQTLLQE